MRSLQGFTGRGYDRGRNRVWQAGWVVCQSLLVKRAWMPSAGRVAILRCFGAQIGTGVNLRGDVTIHWPWKLTIGDHSWIGVGAWILNLEPVTIGHDCCISQQVLLCTGSHDHRSPTFEFDNAPIVIGDGVWVAARATVLRGVTIGDEALIGATALVHSDVPAGGTVLATPGRRDDVRA
ncbi:MAG: putative colanic acid biosynthesis acetyltransferase [Acidimicrobiales bacterium]|nr:putative colanic acid biosynthesis acetyltransferase [Acidimicrobiales bacterium]